MSAAKAWWKSASGISAAAAVATAVTAAVAIFIQLGWLGGSQPAGNSAGATIPTGASPSPSAATELVRVEHTTRALSMEVPVDWEVGMSDGIEDFSGLRNVETVGMYEATNMADFYSWKTPTVWLGASTALAEKLGGSSATFSVKADKLATLLSEADRIQKNCPSKDSAHMNALNTVGCTACGATAGVSARKCGSFLF